MKFPQLFKAAAGSPKSERIYLDYAAATPVRKEVLLVMQAFQSSDFGNPGSIHAEGQRALRAVHDARQSLARMLRVRPGDITFTSGGTESNNLAIFGTVERLLEEGKHPHEIEIISTEIEHPSVIESLRRFEARGVRVAFVDVDSDGRIGIGQLEKLLTPKTALVTFAYANSEIGVVQDVKKISRLVRKYNETNGRDIKVHVDASQAPLWLPCQVDMLGVNMLTLDAGKCYGPKGLGVLVHKNAPLMSLVLGGTQEGGLRAGTENVPLIVGGVRAFCIADEGREERVVRVKELRDNMLEKLQKEIPEVVVNGSGEYRIANNVNISLPGFDTEYAVVVLDTNGVAASTKSACGGADGAGSHVVRAIGGDERALSTIRFTLGEETTEAEISSAVQILKDYSERMRSWKRDA